MKIISLFIEGGVFQMILVTLFALLAIFLILYQIRRKFKGMNLQERYLNLIPISGLFAFLFSILFLFRGIFIASSAVNEAGNISSTLLAKGIQVSILTPIYALVVFIVTLIFWLILKQLEIRKSH